MTTARTTNHSTNGHDKLSAITDALETAREAGTVAQKSIVAAAGKTEKMVKQYPLSSVGIALGGGFLLGAFAVKALAHKPTLGESIHESLGLKRRVAQAIQGWL